MAREFSQFSHSGQVCHKVTFGCSYALDKREKHLLNLRNMNIYFVQFKLETTSNILFKKHKAFNMATILHVPLI